MYRFYYFVKEPTCKFCRRRVYVYVYVYIYIYTYFMGCAPCRRPPGLRGTSIRHFGWAHFSVRGVGFVSKPLNF